MDSWEAATAICEQYHNTGCGNCPIQKECTAPINGKLHEWKRKVEMAAKSHMEEKSNE